ncbi:hypothetical protein [Streptomyces sp. GESEQ-35]|uniref:hypothetical protein n=1 Tax=Streptomyces sp. GESEQ-35 TaxID=2812657 RepID=UPI001FF2A7CA|nr:hypothetical protein [Streptomyces sp. GESEQ-35]
MEKKLILRGVFAGAAAGLPVEAAGPELFSRTTQANVGIGFGIVFFGMAMGPLAERLLKPRRPDAAVPSQKLDPLPA